LVTGGGGGIGSAICRRLALAGYAVCVLDRTSETAEGVAHAIRSSGAVAFAVACDVTDAGDVNAACRRVHDEHGRLDLAVNCAALSGTEVKQDLLEVTPERWRRIVDVNLTGAFLVAQAAARIMAGQRSGCIVNVSSVSGIGAEERAAAYCAAKAGMIGMTRAMALDLAPYGVRVCAIAPGDIDTEKSRHVSAADGERYSKTTPLGQGRPEDVAAAVEFVAGDSGRYVSGTTLVIDGARMAY
jgi:NAD(P)-dependent dehydrogenase (short-subunit alcohol dehydrogenase family)